MERLFSFALLITVFVFIVACASAPAPSLAPVPISVPTVPAKAAVPAEKPAAAVAPASIAVAPLVTFPLADPQYIELWYICSDGRESLPLWLSANKGYGDATFNRLVIKNLGGTPVNVGETVARLATQNIRVVRVYSVAHTVLPQCTSCGAEQAAAELRTGGAQNLPDPLKGYIQDPSNMIDPNPFLQARNGGIQGVGGTSGKIEFVQAISGTDTQQMYVVGTYRPESGRWTWVSDEQIAQATGSGWKNVKWLGQSDMSVGAWETVQTINKNALAAAKVVAPYVAHQPFSQVYVTSVMHPVDAFFAGAYDAIPFVVTVDPVHLKKTLDQIEYAILNWKPNTQFKIMAASEADLQAILSLLEQNPRFMKLAGGTGWVGTFNGFIVSGRDPGKMIVLRSPGVPVAKLELPKAAPPIVVAKPLVVNPNSEEALVAKFQAEVRNLGDATKVAAAQANLKAMGAVQVDGAWALVRGGNVWTSGPVRSTVVQRYVGGEISSLTMMTRPGPITLEKAENISGGIAGWRLDIPWLNLNKVSIVGIPASKLVSLALEKGLVLIWVGAEGVNFNTYADHIDHIDVSAMKLQTLQAPKGADYRIWLPTPESPWLQTKWQLTADQLKNGWNGFRNVLPVGKEVPLFLYDGLAGVDVAKGYAVISAGPEGHRISSDNLTLKRTATGYEFRLNGQIVPPNTSGDYVANHMSDFGIWQIPYHFQHGTAACPGLCIQQGKGGLQLIFQQNANPTAIELCPQDDECWKN